MVARLNSGKSRSITHASLLGKSAALVLKFEARLLGLSRRYKRAINNSEASKVAKIEEVTPMTMR